MSYTRMDVFLLTTQALAKSDEELQSITYDILTNMCSKYVGSDYTQPMQDALVAEKPIYMDQGTISDIPYPARETMILTQTRVNPGYTGEYAFTDPFLLDVYGETLSGA